MNAFLARIRAVPTLKLVVVTSSVVFAILLLFAVVFAPDKFVGLMQFTGYVLAVISLAMLVTYVVIRISPSQSAKEQKQQES